jgi:mono/diheme cytochrome c family protein
VADPLSCGDAVTLDLGSLTAGNSSSQSRNRFLKWGGVALAAVLAVAVSSVSALAIAGMVKQHARSAPVPDLKVEATPERIARGKALVDGFCSACHSKTGTLTGGLDIGKDFPMPVGSFLL